MATDRYMFLILLSFGGVTRLRSGDALLFQETALLWGGS